jgi:hypothetical protein
MEKIIKILGLATLVSFLFTMVLWVTGALWHTPDEGVVHNLCRISILCSATLGSVFVFMFVYKESKDY